MSDMKFESASASAIQHHPDELLIAEFASGALDDASSLVLAAHMALCPHCRNVARDFECIGGHLLEEAPVDIAAAGRHAESVNAIAADQSPHRAAAQARTGAEVVASMIQLYGRSNWKWIGPGVHRSDINLSDNGMRAFLLRAAPGTSMPHHTHTGSELTLVLKGEFQHELGRFQVGDLEEADGQTDHTPIIGRASECVCLVAMESTIKLPGALGRILQPFVRV